MKIKPYEKLSFADDFMFFKVMNNMNICKKVLETVLNIKIKDIELVETQKTLEGAPDSKGIRLDVLVTDDKGIKYVIEMQNRHESRLPNRIRYYQGMIDTNDLEKGVTYENLKKSFIIFICTFDEFKKGRHMYTFNYVCEEDPDIRLKDAGTFILLNTNSSMNDVNPKLKNFLDYIKTKMPVDEFTTEINEIITQAKKIKNGGENIC